MKLKSASILTIATLMVGMASANAGLVFDFYTGATAGFGRQELKLEHVDEYKAAAQSYGAVVGVDIPVVRLEAEYNYLDGKYADTQIATVNAYIKMPGLVVLTPYIGGGIGAVLNVDMDKDEIGASFDYDKSGKPVYQGMLGATLDIPALPFKIDVEGRVLYTSALVDIPAPVDDSISALHYDARVKVRYIF